MNRITSRFNNILFLCDNTFLREVLASRKRYPLRAIQDEQIAQARFVKCCEDGQKIEANGNGAVGVFCFSKIMYTDSVRRKSEKGSNNG